MPSEVLTPYPVGTILHVEEFSVCPPSHLLVQFQHSCVAFVIQKLCLVQVHGQQAFVTEHLGMFAHSCMSLVCLIITMAYMYMYLSLAQDLIINVAPLTESSQI